MVLAPEVGSRGPGSLAPGPSPGQNAAVDFLLAHWPQALILLALAAFGSYVAIVAREVGDESPERPKPAGRAAAAKGSTPAPARPAVRSSAAKKPVIRPAVGAVAASASPSPARADRLADHRGLLDAVLDGPDYRRRSAARALGVALAGTRAADAVAVLADAIRNEEYGFTVRAEAYCALRQVADSKLPWEEEVAVRKGFPQGADLDWVADVEDAICPPAEPS
jgi:hypothetical protein